MCASDDACSTTVRPELVEGLGPNGGVPPVLETPPPHLKG